MVWQRLIRSLLFSLLVLGSVVVIVFAILALINDVLILAGVEPYLQIPAFHFGSDQLRVLSNLSLILVGAFVFALVYIVAEPGRRKGGR